MSNVTDDFWDRLNQEIDDKMNFLAMGKCEDFAEYKRLVGFIAGLRHAKVVYAQLVVQADED